MLETCGRIRTAWSGLARPLRGPRQGRDGAYKLPDEGLLLTVPRSDARQHGPRAAQQRVQVGTHPFPPAAGASAFSSFFLSPEVASAAIAPTVYDPAAIIISLTLSRCCTRSREPMRTAKLPRARYSLSTLRPKIWYDTVRRWCKSKRRDAAKSAPSAERLGLTRFVHSLLRFYDGTMSEVGDVAEEERRGGEGTLRLVPEKERNLAGDIRSRSLTAALWPRTSKESTSSSQEARVAMHAYPTCRRASW